MAIPNETRSPASGSQPTHPSFRPAGRWKGLAGELAIAVPPTVIVLVAFFATQGVVTHRILFASLASSAFLIYRDPGHRMNSVRVMTIAQLLGAGLGIASALILGPGYLAGGVAMGLTILILIALDVVHPPAVSTALGFAFLLPHTKTLAIFLAALLLVTVLAILQRVVTWTVKRIETWSGTPRSR